MAWDALKDLPAFRRERGASGQETAEEGARWVPGPVYSRLERFREGLSWFSDHAEPCGVVCHWAESFPPLGARLQADQTQSRAGGSTVVPHGGGDVRSADKAEQADRQVSKRGHHLGACPLAHLRAILVEGDVPDPVEPVLDRPVSSDEFEQPAGRCLFRGQAGNALDDLMAKGRPVQLPNGSFYLEDLPTVGEFHVVVEVGADPDLAYLDAAVTLIDRFGVRGKKSRARGL